MNQTSSTHEEHFLKLTSLAIKEIPQVLKDTSNWLLWQPNLTTVNSEDKVIKKPLGGKDWQKQSKSFEATLKSYKKKQENYPTGLGFLYTTNHPFICVDIDEHTPDNLQLQSELNSYTERSPSGNGTHIYVQCFTLSDKAQLLEDFGQKRFDKKNFRDLFISSGYTTVTGDLLDNSPTEIRLISYEDLHNTLSKYFNPKITTLHPGVSTTPSIVKKKYNAEQVRLLLRKINVRNLTSDIFERLSHPIKLAILDPEETEEAREPWLIICQGVHHNFSGEADGLFLLHEWSANGDKYDKAAMIDVYESFSTAPEFVNQRRPVTIGSLIALVNAQQPDFSDRNTKGFPLATIQNLETYLKFYKYNMRYNIITMEAEVEMPPAVMDKLSYSNNKISDIDAVHRIVSSELLKLNMATSNFVSLRNSILDYAQLDSYNPIENYFKKLEAVYDETKDPLEELMGTITIDPIALRTGTRDGIKMFLRKWLIQVAAAAHTSNKYSSRMFNNVLIFTGHQGIGKTKWVSALFPEEIKHYCSGSGSLRVQQFRSDAVKQAMELQRTLICNINEIDQLFSPKSYSAFKQLLDENTNSMVMPYGRSAVTMVRRTVFIGSTNKTDFLVDQTGNRRITVIPAIDLHHGHKIDTDQLWAHVVHWYNMGEHWWMDKEVTNEAQAIAIQSRINNSNMFLGDENLVEDLDAYFDVDAAEMMYEKVPFRQVRNAIPGIANYRVNSRVFNGVKATFVNWLKQTQFGQVCKKSDQPRAAQYYLVPPLRNGTQLSTLKQVADQLPTPI